MNLPMELALVVGVLALYLQDSMLLLHYDEVVLVRSRRRWSASTGSDIEFGGRRLFLANPFLPTGAVFRTTWLDDGQGQARTHWAGLNHFVTSLGALRAGCRLLWALLILALPALLAGSAHPLLLLALTALIYGTCGWLALQLWRYRRVFGLSRCQALSTGFQAVCCPPLAINLVRHLSLRRGLQGNAIDAVAHLLAEGTASRVGAQIGQRLAMAMDFNDNDERLLRARQRLQVLQ